jgi:hypothetical protein
MTEESNFDFWQGKRFFSFHCHFYAGPGVHSTYPTSTTDLNLGDEVAMAGS